MAAAARRVISPVRAAALAALALALGGVAGASSHGAAASAPGPAAAPRPASSGSVRIRHFLYVFPDRGMLVYDADHGDRLVQRRAFPQLRGIRGVVASPATGRLYVSFGSDAGDRARGSMIAYDLLTDRVLWQRRYRFGVDSMAITPDGRRIFMPVGEASQSRRWEVIDARSGRVFGVMRGDPGPHNTVVSLDGRRVYLGARNGDFLDVADTSSLRVIRRIGPLLHGVRPFTIDGRERFAFTTAGSARGFQVSSIATGKVLYTVGFGPYRGPPDSAPSHGVSMSPDERELWVVDHPAGALRVFDVRGLPGTAPRELAVLPLRPGFTGTESPCTYACDRSGWVQHSLDGRFAYVGDAGEVIATRTRRTVAVLASLRNTRKSIEIDWRAGRPVTASSRTGLGRVTGP